MMLVPAPVRRGGPARCYQHPASPYRTADP